MVTQVCSTQTPTSYLPPHNTSSDAQKLEFLLRETGGVGEEEQDAEKFTEPERQRLQNFAHVMFHFCAGFWAFELSFVQFRLCIGNA